MTSSLSAAQATICQAGTYSIGNAAECTKCEPKCELSVNMTLSITPCYLLLKQLFPLNTVPLNTVPLNTVPLNTAPPNTTALPIPPPIFKSQIWVYYVIYDSQYRCFRNTAAFSPVPRSAVLRGLTVPPPPLTVKTYSSNDGAQFCLECTIGKVNDEATNCGGTSPFLEQIVAWNPVYFLHTTKTFKKLQCCES